MKRTIATIMTTIVSVWMLSGVSLAAEKKVNISADVRFIMNHQEPVASLREPARNPYDSPKYRGQKHQGQYKAPRHKNGHWETRKVWIPPVYEKVWNPGHYNRRNQWVCGKWITIEKEPGHWVMEKVWVADHRGRPKHRY